MALVQGSEATSADGSVAGTAPGCITWRESGENRSARTKLVFIAKNQEFFNPLITRVLRLMRVFLCNEVKSCWQVIPG